MPFPSVGGGLIFSGTWYPPKDILMQILRYNTQDLHVQFDAAIFKQRKATMQ